MATKAQLAKAALKSAALISKSNDAFKPSKIDHLLRSCARLGFTLLITATSIQAQTLALTEGYSDPTPLSSVRKTTTPKHKIQVREYDGRTPDTYKMRNGTVLDVFQTEDARYYVIRPNGRKFFPKSLNPKI